MPLDYASVAPAQPWIAARFSLVAFGGGVAAFIGFCALDFIEVKFAPSRLHNFYWLLWLFPLATGFAAARILHRATPARRIGFALLAAAVASVVAWGLIMIPGMLFHVGIGGKMDL